MADIHDKYVVPADKASNNVIFGMGSNGEQNKTYQAISKQEILSNHKSVLSSYGLYRPRIRIMILYWIPKLHKDPYLQRFSAGSFTIINNHPLQN